MSQSQLVEDKLCIKEICGIFLPPQPQILVDLQMEQVMPDPCLKEIARLINTDPGLAASVLKAANLYAKPDDSETIVSVDAAVQALGADAVLNVVNGLAIKGELEDKQIQQLSSFWDTATDVARISAAIAEKVGCQQLDRFYLLGLFHNCGMALLMRDRPEYPEVIQDAYAEKEKRIIDVENERLKTNHAVLGYYTARSWHVSKQLCDVIADHHSAQKIFCAENTSYCPEKKMLLAVLKMAESLCHVHSRVGHCDEDVEWSVLQDPVLDYLGLSDYDYDMFQDMVPC